MPTKQEERLVRNCTTDVANLGGAYQQKAKDDTSHKDPLGYVKRNLDLAIVSTFLVYHVGPSTRRNHSDRGINIETVYSEIFEHEYVDEEIAEGEV